MRETQELAPRPEWFPLDLSQQHCVPNRPHGWQPRRHLQQLFLGPSHHCLGARKPSVDLLHQRTTSRSGMSISTICPASTFMCSALWERDLVGDALARDHVAALHVCHLDVSRLAQVLRQSRSSTCCLAAELLMCSSACRSANMQIRNMSCACCRTCPSDLR